MTAGSEDIEEDSDDSSASDAESNADAQEDDQDEEDQDGKGDSDDSDDEHEEEYALLGSKENLRDGGDAVKDLLASSFRIVCFVWVLVIVEWI